MLSADHCLVLVCDQCADALVGQHLQQHRMSNTAVDENDRLGLEITIGSATADLEIVVEYTG